MMARWGMLSLTVLVVMATTVLSSSEGLLAPVHDHPALVSGEWVLIDNDDVGGGGGGGGEHVVTILMKQSNTNVLEDMFWKRTNPTHPQYRQWLSADDITNLVQPSTHTSTTITRWLRSLGATKIELRGSNDVVRATMPVRAVNKGFGVNLRMFGNPRDGRRLRRAYERYTIGSAEVDALVDVVKGINDFPLGRKRRAITMPPSSSSSSSINAPVVSAVRARGSGVSITIQPRCMDGSAPTSPTNMCSSSSSSSVVTGFECYAKATNPAYAYDKMVTVDVANVTCTDSGSGSGGGGGGGGVVCVIELATPELVPNYYVVMVSVVTVYAHTTKSDVGAAPFPTMPTPPVLPQQLYQLYNMPLGLKATNPHNSISVVEFEQQYYSPADLTMFFEQMGMGGAGVVTVVGPNDEGNAGVEANLDIQYAMAMSMGVPCVFWSVKANSSEEVDDILSWAYTIGNTTSPPLVNSLSYGMAADQVDAFLGANYVQRSDTEFMKLALRGVTIIIASGDTGVGDLGAPPMSEPTCDVFHADWPSQSAYVTSVGSTAMTPQSLPVCYDHAAGVQCIDNPLGEVLASLEQGGLFTGGGGFSKRTPVPWYQQVMVDAYVNMSRSEGVLPPTSMFNIKGHNLMVTYKGKQMAVDGTSASAPIFAGMVAMLNEAELNGNRQALGFINPLMYQIAASAPQTFNDVTVGSNACGAYGWTPLCCASGFHAMPGFDATTGLGSPNFGEIRALLN